MTGFAIEDVEHGAVIYCAQCCDQPEEQDAPAAEADGWRSTRSEGRAIWLCPPHWKVLGL